MAFRWWADDDPLVVLILDPLFPPQKKKKKKKKKTLSELDPLWQNFLDPRMMVILLSTKFILLINVKMPTIISILTFISMISTTSERLKARNIFNYRYFSFNEHLKFRAQLK